MRKIIFFILLTHFSAAQNFHYSSSLPVVDSSGFYKIKLLPEIKSKMKQEMPDLRLFDNENKETPYIIKSEAQINYVKSFVQYQIDKKTVLPDSITRLVIRKDSSRIDNIVLQIRNAEVSKKLKISGSFDTLQWFVVKDFHLINSVNNTDDVMQQMQISFPVTNYIYYKIEINDRDAAPLDIVSAGYFKTVANEGVYSQLNAEWMTTDSAERKMSFVFIDWKEVTDVDAFELKINSPAHYHRRAVVCSMWKQDTKYTRKPFNEVILSSEHPTRFTFPGIRASKFLIEIYNEDDQPLKFADAKTFQLNHYCIAYLEKNKRYQFRYDAPLLDFPNYDLTYFEKIIPVDLPVLVPNKVVELSDSDAKAKPSSGLLSDKRLIWAALVLTVGVLGFITYRMIKEMK